MTSFLKSSLRIKDFFINFESFFFYLILIMQSLLIYSHYPISQKTSSKILDINIDLLEPSLLYNLLQIGQLLYRDLLRIHFPKCGDKLRVCHRLPCTCPTLLSIKNDHDSHQYVFYHYWGYNYFTKVMDKLWFKLFQNLLRNFYTRNWQTVVGTRHWNVILFYWFPPFWFWWIWDGWLFLGFHFQHFIEYKIKL